MFSRRAAIVTALLVSWPTSAKAAPQGSSAVIQLFRTQQCNACNLNDADLVHSQLNNVELKKASLQRANLNHAKLNNSDLSNSDLSFANLQGTSLQGANLTGAKLFGTDLRGADLTHAKLSIGALAEAHWEGAIGIEPGIQSHAELHNAGVDAAQTGRWGEAETLFGLAIKQSPNNGMSWVARGIARSQLVKDDLAAADWSYAAALFKNQGSEDWAEQLDSAAALITKRRHLKQPAEPSNGLGSNLLSGFIGGLTSIAPIALQALKYAGVGIP